jgi:signal peptidase I
MGYNWLKEPIDMKTAVVREVLITLALALAIFFLARASLQTYEVFQTSMLPNFTPGERVVVAKAVYWFSGPSRGDVVVFHAPNGLKENWIKRIIGLPGDTVEVKSGHLYVNDVLLNEPYIKRSFTYTMPKLTVPADHYFFLGDNRDVSNDSSHGWLITKDALIGKAWLISWPPSDWSIAHSYSLATQLTLAK